MSRLMHAVAGVCWIAFVVVNYGSGSGWFGKTNSERSACTTLSATILCLLSRLGIAVEKVSAMYPTLLTPSGWAFSIWGIIIAGQGAACIYLFIPSSENSEQWKRRVAGKVLHWWMLGWLCECCWQFCFTQATAPYMIACTAFLLGALFSFQKALANIHEMQQSGAPALPSTVFALFFGPTSINAAWLSVATSIGILIALKVSIAASQMVFAIALALAIVGVGVHITVAHKDVFYSVTLLWSFAAVYGNQRHAPWPIRALCITALVVLMPVSLSSVLRRRSARSRGLSPTTTPQNGSALLAEVPDRSDSAALRVPVS